jgi:hypothetical protein
VSFAVVAAISTALGLVLTSPFNHAIVVSIIRDTAESHGLDPDDFLRTAEIESGFDPSAYHPVSKASGLFQFLPATARQYQLTAVFDARANAEAAAALWIDNRRVLRRALRRDPTAGEVYLAHQQGAGGAINLLIHPDKPATEIVGYDAVTMNGGTDDMTAEAFAAKWINRFQQD